MIRSQPKVALAINKHFVGKATKTQLKQHADKWERVTMTPREVCRMAIDPSRGYAWTCDIQPGTNRRKEDTFASVRLLGLDFDAVSMENVLDHYELAQECASFAYESASSTDENPRCRLVFCTETPLAFEPASVLLKALHWHFHEAEADKSTKDPTRMWYGAPGKRALARRWSVLDAATAVLLVEEYERAHPAPSQPSIRLTTPVNCAVPWRWQAAFQKALQKVRYAPNGSRNSTLYGQARVLFEWANSGALTTQAAEEWLLDAALTAGLDESEARKAIAHAKAKTGAAMRIVRGSPLGVTW